MAENIVDIGDEMTGEDPAEARARLEERAKEIRAKAQEAQEALKEGKGRLKLEKPIMSGDTEITELEYDFTELTGLEYAEAMDSDYNAAQIFKITYRQGLALFARAAAKYTQGLDMRGIIEQIGMTDAVQGVQLAALFFNASARAAFQRISKR